MFFRAVCRVDGWPPKTANFGPRFGVPMPPLPQFRVSVFDDIFDRLFVEDSSDEVRFILVGLSLHSGVLVVVNCHRDEDSVIRIISARKATNREGNFYLLDCVKHNRKISLEWVA